MEDRGLAGRTLGQYTLQLHSFDGISDTKLGREEEHERLICDSSTA